MPVVSEQIAAAGKKYESDPELIEQNLVRLQQWLTTQTHLPEVSDTMLLQFHHSCYYDLDTTKNCIVTYYTMRTNMPEIFTNRDVRCPELVKAIEGVNMAVLPSPELDHTGYHIIYSGLKSFEPTSFMYVEANKLLIMCMDSCAARYGPLAGIIHIHDMKGAKLGHLARCSLSWIRKLMAYTQEALPFRVKEVHIINVVPWIDKIMTLMRPFMKAELRKMLHFHASNSEALFEFLPKKYLPEDLGGSLPTIEVLTAQTREDLESLRGMFEEEEKSRLNENQREKRDFEPETKFGNLDID